MDEISVAMPAERKALIGKGWHLWAVYGSCTTTHDYIASSREGLAQAARSRCLSNRASG